MILKETFSRGVLRTPCFEARDTSPETKNQANCFMHAKKKEKTRTEEVMFRCRLNRAQLSLMADETPGGGGERVHRPHE